MKKTIEVFRACSFHRFLSMALLILLTLTLGCSGSNNQVSDQNTTQTPPPSTTTPPPTTNPPTPTPDPLVTAKDFFKQNVFDHFFRSDRCLNCHDFDNRRVNGPLTFHTSSTACTTCHTTNVFGSGFNQNWRKAPDVPEMRWADNSNADDVRQQIIDRKGAGLFDHLCGNDPFVQWCFFNAPNTDMTFALPNKIYPGGVPSNGPHSGRIMPIANASPPPAYFESEHTLMDFDKFKKAVQDWMCLEAKVPGAQPLGNPDPCP